VQTLGSRISLELGIDLDRDPAEAERWALAVTLLGNRISTAVAMRTLSGARARMCSDNRGGSQPQPRGTRPLARRRRLRAVRRKDGSAAPRACRRSPIATRGDWARYGTEPRTDPSRRGPRAGGRASRPQGLLAGLRLLGR